MKCNSSDIIVRYRKGKCSYVDVMTRNVKVGWNVLDMQGAYDTQTNMTLVTAVTESM
jgi:hypothetical protein